MSHRRHDPPLGRPARRGRSGRVCTASFTSGVRAMMRRRHWFSLAALLVATALCAGCKVRGGGWFISCFSGEKVTFSVNGDVTEYFPYMNGQGEYHGECYGYAV